MIMVGADVPRNAVSSAAMGLGTLNASRSGILRAALALFHGADTSRAREYAVGKAARLESNDQDWLNGAVPDEFADTGEVQRAYAIRVGLGIAAGMSREAAEDWADCTIRKPGRPQGAKDRKPRKRRNEAA
jgi:hypothetical protein